MKGKRRKFSGEDKVRILKRHLVDQVPISDVCEEHGLHPTMFYKWQKEFFENGAAAFERQSDAKSRRLEKENAALKTRIAQKDEVIAEIMESHVALKKSLGES
ncbi:MAG: transposase [Proteobacteria bacterium]|nr:transposase [Pseudomonadota bacterium]